MSLARGSTIVNTNDARILSYAQLNAELSIPEIAKGTKLSSAIVRRTLTRLSDTGLIRRFWYINVYALGYTVYTFYFTLLASHAPQRSKLIKYLTEHPAVVFFFETSGHYDYGLSIQTASVTEFSTFMGSIGERFGECFLNKSTAILLSLTDFPLIKSPQLPGSVTSLRMGTNVELCKTDDLDRRILDALIADPSAQLTLIARKLGQPFTTVAYRFSRLKKSGVIAGSRYFIDYLQLGLSFAGHQISLAGCSPADIEHMLKYFAEHHLVYYVEHSIGPWDFEVGTLIRSREDSTRFTRDVTERFGKFISKIDSFVTCGFLKLNGSPYFPAEQASVAY